MFRFKTPGIRWRSFEADKLTIEYYCKTIGSLDVYDRLVNRLVTEYALKFTERYLND